MSSRIRPGCAVLAVTLAALGACVDPKARFDEFAEKVVDAQANRIDGSGSLFEIDGEFLLALVPSFSPSRNIRFIVTSEITIEGNTGTVDMSFQPLISERCVEGEGGNPVGDPIVANDVPVGEDGVFELGLTDAMVDADANDVSCGETPVRADFDLTGQIRSVDMFCGDVDGRVEEPVPNDLAGSTFGSIRIEPGTTGDANLPEPLLACP